MVATAADFLFSRLSADANVTGFVGDRIAQSGNENLAYPNVVYAKTGGEPIVSHDGHNDTKKPVYTLTCWSYNPSEVDNLAEAVKDALVDYSGTTGGVQIQDVLLLNEGDVSAQKDGATYFGRRLIFQIWYEAVPA